MKRLLAYIGIASLVAAAWSCGKKKSDDEAPKSTVSAEQLIIPMNLKCGDKPCIN